MRKVTVLFAVVGLLAWTVPARGVDFVFDDGGAGHGWSVANNWDQDLGFPDSSTVDNATVGNGYTVETNSWSCKAKCLDVGTASGAGTVWVKANLLYTGEIYLGSGGGAGTLKIDGTARTTTAASLYIGGGGSDGLCEIIKNNTGYTCVSARSVILDRGDQNTDKGTLTIGDPADIGAIIISETLDLGGSNTLANNNVFLNAPNAGTVLKMVRYGGNLYQADFANRLLGTKAGQVADLINVTMIFEASGAVHANGTGAFEVGGDDLGAVLAGFNNNFAMNKLQIGSAGNDNAKVMLVDDYDNQADGADDEALYVHDIEIQAGSTLDLGAFNIYYDGTLTEVGSVDRSGGGDIIFIPEPATMSLLVLGGISVLIRRKRR